jgi:hypothetical protein
LAISRRDALKLLAAGALAGMAPSGSARSERADGARSGAWLGARGDREGRYGVARIDARGAARAHTPLPFRAHAVAVSPDARTAVAVARRPGTLAALLDAGGRVVGTFHADAGRHFEGHGAFSADGLLFFTSENDYAAGRGVVGVRSVAEGFRRIAEWPSAGIGPHELALGADGRTLVVANGGILTHPDSGRTTLNPDSMSPSLARLAADSGRLLDQAALDPRLAPLSIRHLAVTPSDDVVFGVQDEGLGDPGAPVVGVWRRSGSLDLLAPRSAPARAQGYVGGVALDLGGRLAAASEPREGRVAFFEVSGGRWLSEVAAEDACGVAPCPQPAAFRVSTGTGVLLEVARVADRMESRTLSASTDPWDNHLTFLAGAPGVRPGSVS